jgi:hypothetical protein
VDFQTVDMYGTSTPLYLGFATNNDDIKLSAFSNSNDIDLNKLDSLQIEKIIQCI